MEIHVKEEKARREKSVSAEGPGMKMASCRSAAVGFLPVISRLHHYRICRSEEKQSAAASLTCCWVPMLSSARVAAGAAVARGPQGVFEPIR